MGAVTYGDVLRGAARPEELVPFGGEQAHKAFALALGLQLLVGALAGDGYGAVLLVARPEADPVPALREPRRRPPAPRRRVAAPGPRPRRPTPSAPGRARAPGRATRAPRRAAPPARRCRRGGRGAAGARACSASPASISRAPRRSRPRRPSGTRRRSTPTPRPRAPGLPPSARTVVAGFLGAGVALHVGSRRKTAEPAGASTSSPSSMKVARPASTT